MKKGILKNKVCRMFAMALGVGLLLSAFCPQTAMAASRKKITSVKLKISGRIKPGTRFGEEDLEFETGKTSRYVYDTYDIVNDGFEWYMEDVPVLEVYLKAVDGYYFSMSKASSVTIDGGTYKKAEKQDSAETLKLTVELPPLSEMTGDMGAVTLTERGYAYWDDVLGAGSYEVRIYRNGQIATSSEITVTETQVNLQRYMKRPGSYYCCVRACNVTKPENKSEWVDSALRVISSEQAALIRSGVESDRPLSGEWVSDADGRWQYVYKDGTGPRSCWLEIDGKWYFFDADGYMQTGWIEWEGKEYYCDTWYGYMLTDTTTPDGYMLDANGNKKNGR